MEDSALTPNITSLIYEDGTPPAITDPSEYYFESSKLHRNLSALEVPGILLLESSPWLVEQTAKSGRMLDHRESIKLPSSTISEERHHVERLLRSRRSPESFTPYGPTLDELAQWCEVAIGKTGQIGGLYEGRPYPSGGGLRPCDIFLSIYDSDEIPGGTYHYNSRHHKLEHYGDMTPRSFGSATLQPELFQDCSVVWTITASLWRSRFKYSQRALRFSLMEAGHIAQNIILSVMSGDHAARPVGGFYDDELADLLRMDGVHDVPLYMVVSGKPTQA